MGFSPGDFTIVQSDLCDYAMARDGLHFERKANGRIILWSHDEAIILLEVDLRNARLMVDHLATLLETKV